MARSVPKCKRAAYVYDRDFIVVDDISGVLKMRSECAIDGYGFLSSQGDIRNPQEIPLLLMNKWRHGLTQDLSGSLYLRLVLITNTFYLIISFYPFNQAQRRLMRLHRLALTHLLHQWIGMLMMFMLLVG
jgi:hypothetical protein